MHLSFCKGINANKNHMSVPDIANKIIGKIVNKVTSSVSQTSAPADGTTYPEVEGIKNCCFNAAAESFVLLKNDLDVLPFSSEETVSIFGRVQYDTFFVGYGSGGDVNPHYTVSISEGIKNNGKIKINKNLDDTYRKWIKRNPVDDGYWGHWPMSYKEMHVSEAMAAETADNSDAALIIIGRAAGEDRENTLTKGSFYLTDEEENLISAVTAHFKKTAVILNIGAIMDMSWIDKYSVPCVGICWQGGMETGNAVAAVLSGDISPSGKLTDTIAKRYEDYPSSDNFGGKNKNHYEEDIFVGYRFFETFEKEKVLFEFGYGLSYSSFSLDDIDFEKFDDKITVNAILTNCGNISAKNCVQLYFSQSGSKLYSPSMNLIGFKKSHELAPGEKEKIHFEVKTEELCFYDDSGITGNSFSYVHPKGNYSFYIGFSVRDVKIAGSFSTETDTQVKKLNSHSGPKKSERLMRLIPVYDGDKIYRSYEPTPTAGNDLKNEILSSLPKCIDKKENTGETLFDVSDGKISLEEFVATLSDDELEAISRGDYVMNSPLGPKGNAGVLGGVIQSLRDKGIPPVTTTDGPSGIRLSAFSSLLPCGTALASTFNVSLVEELYYLLGKEMTDRGSDILLAPGMNIHRDPLCGRNFEYYSEDPLIAGRCAAAVVQGLRKAGVFACPKHFACNNQETNRNKNDSVLSERALREIYLKGFEICVKESHPDIIMTSYNKINGVWGHYNYELVTEILRGEWGFDGMVITDWWMRKSRSPEFPEIRDQAYRVRAGVDVLMPGGKQTGKRIPDGTLLETLDKENGITSGELQEVAKHILGFILKTEKFNSLKKENN